MPIELQRTSLFGQLTAAELTQLADLLVRRTYRRGQVVFHQHDPSGRLYVIEEGRVKITREATNGAEMLIDVFGSGDVFGELSIFTNEPRTATVTAIEPAVISSLDRDDFYALMESEPRLAIACLELLARRLRSSDEMLQDMAFLDVPARLAKRLLELAEEHGRDTPEGERLIDIRLTQDELAIMLGTTRESVNKTLALFQRQGLIGRTAGRLVLRDRDRLNKRVY